MAEFTGEYSGTYNRLGIKINLKADIDEGTGTGICYWSASTFTPPGKSDVTYASRKYSSSNNNYITVGGTKRWDFYDIYVNTSKANYHRAAYTHENGYTSNQLDYYSGNYSASMNNQYLWTLKDNFATGNFPISVNANGDADIGVAGHFRMVYDSDGIDISGNLHIHVDLYKKLYKWTPSTGWQLVAAGHKNDNWNRGLNVYKWTPSTGWVKL